MCHDQCRAGACPPPGWRVTITLSKRRAGACPPPVRQGATTLSHEEPPRRRKHIRLDATIYAQSGTICSITIAVKDRQQIFGNSSVATAAVDVLLDLSHQLSVTVFAYCMMPDHVHFVISPCESCDIITFVARFK